MGKFLQPLFVVAALVVGTIGISACGSTGAARESQHAAVTTQVGMRARAFDSDNDDDRRGSHEDPDSDEVLTFGHTASAASAAGMVAFIKSYYGAAAAGNGQAVCAMLDAIAVEAIVEAARQTEASSPKSACARSVERVFARHRRQLAADVASFQLIEARIREGRGLLWLVVGGREVLIQLHPDGGSWQLEAPLEEEGP